MPLHVRSLLCLSITAGIAAADLPERLTATPQGTTTLALAWESVTGADGLVVQRSTTGGDWRDVATLGGSATGYTDAGLPTGALRLYRLVVRNGATTLGYSNLAWGSTGIAVSPTSTTERTVAVRQPDGGIRMYWEHRFADAVRFRLETQVGTGAWTAAGEVAGTAQVALLTDPDPGRSQYLKVRIRPESAGVTGAWAEVFAMQATPYSVKATFSYPTTDDGVTSKPTSLTVTRLGPSTVRFQWSGSAQTLLRALGSGAWHIVTPSPMDGAGTILSLPAHDLPQRFAVANAGGASNVVTVPALVHDDSLPRPTNVQSTKVGSEATVTWQWTGSGATGFVVERQDVNAIPDVWGTVAEVGAAIRTSTVADTGFGYTYRVRATSALGYSWPGSPFASEAAIPAPTNLRQTALSTTAVSLAWDEDPAVYIACVQRAEGAGPWRDLGPTKTSALTDPTVVPGTTYRYRVGGTSRGAFSTELSVTIPVPTAAPGAAVGVSATGVAPGQINLTWNAAAGTPTTAFAIATSPDGSTWTDAATLPGDARAFRLSGLTAGTLRHLRVIARNVAGDAAPVTASATTPGSAPQPTVAVKTSPIGGWRILEVTGTQADDVLELAQSGNDIIVRQDGSPIATRTGPFTEVRLFGSGGNDSLRIDSSVTVRAGLYGGAGDDVLTADGQGPQVVVALGQGRDSASGRTGVVDYWVDGDGLDAVTVAQTDADRVHRVLRFDTDQSRDPLGQNFPETQGFSNSSQARLPDQPLWGDGPGALDINQGNYQDCPVTSYIQEAITASPDLVQRLVVDLGDGTYAVAVEGGFTRFDGEFNPGWLSLAPPSGQVWALVLEKAFTVYGHSLPASLQRPWTSVPLDAQDAERLYQQVRASLRAHRTINVFTRSIPLLDYETGSPCQHAHSLLGAFRAADGTPRFIVRNPYGIYFETGSGFLDWKAGLRTMTRAQMVELFADMTLMARTDAPMLPPTATPAAVTVAAGSSVAIRLTGLDLDGQPLTWTITTQPTRGTLSGTAPHLVYTPTGGTAGSDAVAFTVGNGTATSTPATVAITITGTSANSAPVITMPANAAPTLVLP